MNKPNNRSIFAIICLLILAACANTPEQTAHPIDFGGQPVISFDVARIRIVDATQAIKQADLITTQPLAMIKLWAAQRLRADGNDGTLLVKVQKADITEMIADLPGFRISLKKRTQFRYQGNLMITLEASNNNRQDTGMVDIIHRTTAPEFSARTARRNILNELTHRMGKSLNQGMENVIGKHFQNFVNASN